ASALRRAYQAGAPPVGNPEPLARPPAALVGVGTGEDVVARGAGLQQRHLLAQPVRAAQDRRRGAVGRDDVLPVARLLLPVGGEVALVVVQCNRVEPLLLERCAVPRLQAHLILAAPEPGREMIVRDD